MSESSERSILCSWSQVSGHTAGVPLAPLTAHRWHSSSGRPLACAEMSKKSGSGEAVQSCSVQCPGSCHWVIMPKSARGSHVGLSSPSGTRDQDPKWRPETPPRKMWGIYIRGPRSMVEHPLKNPPVQALSGPAGWGCAGAKLAGTGTRAEQMQRPMPTAKE